MKILIKAIAISTASLFAVQASAADGPKDRMEKHFKEADLNGNGVITHAEMMKKVQEKFAEFDKNRDGFLTLQELPKEMPIPSQVKERMEKRAERMAKRMEERGEEFDPEDMPPPGMMGPGRRGKPTRVNFIARHDKDGDERVSLEEFAEKAVRHFKRADLNGNGEVTKEEAKEALKGHHGKRHGDHPPQPRHPGR